MEEDIKETTVVNKEEIEAEAEAANDAAEDTNAKTVTADPVSDDIEYTLIAHEVPDLTVPVPVLRQVEAGIYPAETEEAVGTVTVLVNGLNIRRAASREAASAGQAENGKEYPVYEITEDGSLTWYRIGEDEWIGCTQDYAEYKPQE